MTAPSWLDVPAASPDPTAFRAHWDPIVRARMAPLKALIDSAHPLHDEARAIFEALGAARNRCDATWVEQALVAFERLAGGEAG